MFVAATITTATSLGTGFLFFLRLCQSLAGAVLHRSRKGLREASAGGDNQIGGWVQRARSAALSFGAVALTIRGAPQQCGQRRERANDWQKILGHQRSVRRGSFHARHLNQKARNQLIWSTIEETASVLYS